MERKGITMYVYYEAAIAIFYASRSRRACLDTNSKSKRRQKIGQQVYLSS